MKTLTKIFLLYMLITRDKKKNQSDLHFEPNSERGCCGALPVLQLPSRPQELSVQLFRGPALTLVLQGASYLTVPASQTLGREPAFHLSFTLLPQIMDLETTVNMQPQGSSAVLSPSSTPLLRKDRVLPSELPVGVH